ncbi:hypothetical protein LTR10_024364 [Elasticomyces elasticus]|uniref:3-carboxymuconate cyclase n=1 Tax=Exophiala sideris TaxID=1016849 RepID=A0ABR0J8C1_9EURO|nr:hypothetical protein LTR10_024364 [Elasticomyces elasticus]KAK5022236.1 hypothetical protein LTS07_010316 [Exophiala sideris]KAK5037323.1 hypothetical protein LTR13_004479 [Exophiala sideris]KAK5058986.1 hypothetical protein LTR69_006273 [Exophiala sideris]KAK5182818.1 hypothetical protein LTR44_004526 [Eurotiomycetes sp. CCFEE 6388]
MAIVQTDATCRTTETSLGFYVALQSTGIVEIDFDPEKGINESLAIVAINTNAGFMPGWLIAFGDTIYSISRTSPFGSDSDSGEVFAFRRTHLPKSNCNKIGLDRIAKASSNGKGGVHCDVSPDGKILAAANITDSTLSIYPLSEDGAIGKIAHIFDYNQSDPGPIKAHPHQTIFDPTGRFLIVPLRTLDRIDIFCITDSQQIERVQSISIPAPAGARHVAFNQITPGKVYMYLVSEKDNSVRVFSLNYTGAELRVLSLDLKQTLSTMGKDLGPSPDEHKDLAAEIAVSSDGRFVYVSNRHLTGMEADNLAIYSVDSEPSHDERHLTYLGSQPTQGKHPRMFALSNDEENKWVAVAHQFSQDIVVFERDTVTGFLRDIKGRISVKVATTHQAIPDKVLFEPDVGMNGKIGRNHPLKGRTEGPVCVLWK